MTRHFMLHEANLDISKRVYFYIINNMYSIRQNLITFI